MSETEGFTKIPHEIMEAIIRSHVSSREVRAFLFIARQTWGWRKESDTIALRQFSNATGIDRRNIHRVLTRLKNAGLIVVASDDRNAATYRINKNISEWCLSSPVTTAREKRRNRRAVVASDDRLSSPVMTGLSSPVMTGLSSPETPSKETLKEKERNLKERGSALRAGAGSPSNSDHSIKATDRTEEARKQKELSKYRNKMFKSGLYSQEEISGFLGKTMEELMQIDEERFAQKLGEICKQGMSEPAGK